LDSVMGMAFARNAIMATGLIILASGAVAAQDQCTALLKQQDEQCRSLAERRQELCPRGEGAHCRQLSEQIAKQCTRKPCGTAPRKVSRTTAKRSRAAGRK
jgi:uncharacterized membrane protein